MTLHRADPRTSEPTPRPWYWAGYVEGSIELRGGRGGQRVITTARSEPCIVLVDGGDPFLADGACASCRHEWAKPHDAFVDRDAPCQKPENLNTVWLRGDGFVEPANRWAVREVPYRGDVARVEHPDAALIVAAVNAYDRLRAIEAAALTVKADHDTKGHREPCAICEAFDSVSDRADPPC